MKSFKYTTLILTLILLFTIALIAQEPDEPAASTIYKNFKIGDAVEYNQSGGWYVGTYEGVVGKSEFLAIRVKPGNYGVESIHLSLVFPRGYREKKLQQSKMLEAFFNETYYLKDAVKPILVGWDKRLYWSDTNYVGAPDATNTAYWTQARRDLAALEKVCQKYPDIVNSPNSDLPHWAANYRYKTWCNIAANREKVIKGYLQSLAEENWKRLLHDRTIDFRDQKTQNGWISNTLQEIGMDFEAWKESSLQTEGPKINMQGGILTDAMLETFRPLSVELKKYFDEQSQKNVWQKPRAQDAVAQNLAKKAMPNDPVIKGAPVLAIGMDDAAWRIYDERNITAVDANFYYYKIEKGKNKFKTGRMLVRTGNYCQERDFYVKQVRGSAKVTLQQLGTLGRFVACP